MGILNTNKVAELKKQSKDAINIWTTTVQKLEATNKATRIEIEKRKAEIEERKKQMSELRDIESGNQIFIEKVQDLLNPKK